MNDLCTREEAEALAKRIYAYWEERGVYPKVWVEDVPDKSRNNRGSRMWCVRSNIELVKGR